MNEMHPRLSWKISSDENNWMQTAYEIRVAFSSEDLKKNSQLVWNSGKILSGQSVHIRYQGKQLEPKKRYFWQVRVWDQNQQVSKWSDPVWWETGFLNQNLWKARWITADGKTTDDHRPVYFRKEFRCSQKIQSARLYISSCGLYEVLLNGQKVTSDLFTPGYTSYNKRIQYQVYDVTSLLKQQNALAAVVADGWFRGNVGGKVKNNYFGDKSALIAQMEITLADGSTVMVGTDDQWKTADGPILSSDIYNGETYDSRLELKGWAYPGFDEQTWVRATILDKSTDLLVATVGNPVRAISEIVPVKLFKTPKGETVFDMGQNMVGWVRLKVTGKKDDRVVLRFAELLDREGNFYTENLRTAKATDEYILNGKGLETFEPHFTFHGFRFVKLEQFPGDPDLQTITGVVIHSDMQPTGSFVCSDSLINQLQHNIQWGQKGNFLDVPTDCPQRDERLGWTGDAQVFAPTAAFNFNVAPFFTKWLLDLAADQLPDGKVPDVVPDVRSGRGSSTAWGDAAWVVPWTLYEAYGDTTILEKQYSSMKEWIEFMHTRAGEKNLWTDDAHYGDWLAFATTRSDYPGATTEKDLIATAYYAAATKRLAQIARILKRTDDIGRYEKLSGDIRTAFIREFVTPSGRLVSNTQTAYALALSFNLIPEELIAKSAAYLANDVRKMKHLTTGFVGTPLLCKALSDHGYADLAFMLLMRKEYPSWLYPVTRGATTIWERWDGIKPDGTFQDVSMNSYNHYAYGAIGEWLYRYIAGIAIDPEQPGYKHFFLNPHSGGRLTMASARYESLYGTICSEWKISGDQMFYSCQIPANTTATVCFSGISKEQLVWGKQSLLNQNKIKTDTKNGNLLVSLGSGHYEFSYPVKQVSSK